MANDGKREARGLRVVYYWIRDEDTIYMLTVYTKSRQDDLTAGQIRLLSRLAQEELG